jgi:hypothetical protein
MTPYEAFYGVPPPRLLSYVSGTTGVEAVDEVLRNREQIIRLLQHNIKQAQQRMKKYVNLHRSEREFQVRQAVYLRLQPYRQTTVAHRRVGKVAYELDLPLEARIHPVFHVSQLKLKLGSTAITLPKLPPINAKGVLQLEPVEVLGRRAQPKGNRPLIEILVRWEGQTADNATWEEFHRLRDAYPHLVGKVF